MLFRRLFKRRRTCSSADARKQTCLCTTAKRDSMYDDVSFTWIKTAQQSSFERNAVPRTDKPRRSTRHSNIEESDRDEDLTITEKLRRASPQNPANIPMLVVISFTPDAKGLQKKQIEIQRGFPVNAQYIVNEWLCIKTADNDQGFVPYLCCRPMLRRLLNRSVDPSSYKLFNFDNDLNGLSSRKAPIVSNSTPTTKKKVSIANQPLSSVNSCQKQKQIEQTSSSCAGDSGVSDCESSSNPQQTNRSLKQTGLIVQDVPSRKVIQTNPSLLSRPDLFHPIKSQLAISTNSAFTQIIKKTGRFENSNNANQRRARSPHIRSYQYDQEALATSLKSNSSRIDENSENTINLSSLSSKCQLDESSSLSSPQIRRTPFVRRSLPHTNNPSILKKSCYSKSPSSPDPFVKRNEKSIRRSVQLDPNVSLINSSLALSCAKFFSDLSLNQIENDSLSSSSNNNNSSSNNEKRANSNKRNQLNNKSSYSTCSTSSSISDDSTSLCFVQTQQTNNYLTDRKSIPVAHNNKTASFIHNVSITV